MLDPAPLSVGGHDLKGHDGLAPQKRDGAAVCVPLHPDVLRLELVVIRPRIASTSEQVSGLGYALATR